MLCLSTEILPIVQIIVCIRMIWMIVYILPCTTLAIRLVDRRCCCSGIKRWLFKSYLEFPTHTHHVAELLVCTAPINDEVFDFCIFSLFFSFCYIIFYYYCKLYDLPLFITLHRKSEYKDIQAYTAMNHIFSCCFYFSLARVSDYYTWNAHAVFYRPLRPFYLKA